jgi:hypothetical protein
MTIQPIPRIVIRGEQKENSYSIELLLISYSESHGKAWFDRLTTSSSTSPSTEFILSKAEGLRTSSPQAVRQALRLRLAHLCYEPFNDQCELRPPAAAGMTRLNHRGRGRHDTPQKSGGVASAPHDVSPLPFTFKPASALCCEMSWS